MAIPPLTTETKVRLRLSTYGVDLRIDHLPAGALTEVILAASCDVAVFLSRYPLAARGSEPGLADSDVVASWAADVAVCHLCRLRGNPVPASLKERCEWVFEQLALVQAGKQNIPDLSNAAGTPAVVNYDVRDDLYPHKRRLAQRSIPGRPTGYPSYTDRREPYPRS
ncbi:MAG: hypothetical protein VKJ09_15610 [Leptolyngbya sp.]|nr:hypothetical protein [Leptolyngbya sp.]